MKETTSKALTTKEVLENLEFVSKRMKDIISKCQDLDAMKEVLQIQNKSIGHLIEICIKQENKTNILDKTKVTTAFTLRETRVLNEIIEHMIIPFFDEDTWLPSTLSEWIEHIEELADSLEHLQLSEKLNTKNKEVLNEIKIMIYDAVGFNEDVSTEIKQEILQSIGM